MSDKIKVEEILQKHVGKYWLEDHTDNRLRDAIKEIVEAALDRAAEEAKVVATWSETELDTDFMVYKDSILKIKEEVDYD